MQEEIVIFGAGVIGASVAYHLAQRGCRQILVLDRAAAPGGGSTARATGGFRAQFDNETEVRLSLLSREKLQAFKDETGVDSGYRPHGYLFLGTSATELETLRVAQQVQHSCGLTEARMLSADEVRAMNPAVGDATVIGAAFCPTDGFLRPMNILQGYVEAATRLGVRFSFDVEVLELRDGVARTSRGDVTAPVFVNAMGAWAGGPVVPLRRNVAATIPTALLPETMPMTIWSADWYHLRVRDGRILLLWPDDPIVDDWLARVQQMTRERAPSIAHLPIEECWSGFYEMTPDGHALLGRVSETLYVANGCSGHGVMHAPAIGQLVAEMILDEKTSIDVSALRPERFSV